jgi:hypothetical protein
MPDSAVDDLVFVRAGSGGTLSQPDDGRWPAIAFSLALQALREFSHTVKNRRKGSMQPGCPTHRTDAGISIAFPAITAPALFFFNKSLISGICFSTKLSTSPMLFMNSVLSSLKCSI